MKAGSGESMPEDSERVSRDRLSEVWSRQKLNESAPISSSSGSQRLGDELGDRLGENALWQGEQAGLSMLRCFSEDRGRRWTRDSPNIQETEPPPPTAGRRLLRNRGCGKFGFVVVSGKSFVAPVGSESIEVVQLEFEMVE